MTRPVRRLRAESICAVIEYVKWHGGIDLTVVNKAERELELMNATIDNTKVTNERLRNKLNRLYSENYLINEREK